jgi:glycosyltransferase involved in cell wall biosynthesis
VLLEALALLKRDYPGLRLRVPGGRLRPGSWQQRLRCDGYWKYLVHRIRVLGLDEQVESLGVLDARAMAEELAAAHVFVAPSFVENLSNSLAEAMLVGTPCVASYAGGMVTTVHDRVEALAFPAGEAAMLAERIRSLLEDDDLARTLSRNARRTARQRHDPQRVTDEIVSIYQAVVGEPATALV